MQNSRKKPSTFLYWNLQQESIWCYDNLCGGFWCYDPGLH